ncbi:MAG: hypothetical protein ACUVTZ_13610, partial [Armatimonadota bacterium]
LHLVVAVAVLSVVALGLAAWILARVVRVRWFGQSKAVTCLICGRRRRVTASVLQDGFFICRCGQKVLIPDPDSVRKRNRL